MEAFGEIIPWSNATTGSLCEILFGQSGVANAARPSRNQVGVPALDDVVGDVRVVQSTVGNHRQSSDPPSQGRQRLVFTRDGLAESPT